MATERIRFFETDVQTFLDQQKAEICAAAQSHYPGDQADEQALSVAADKATAHCPRLNLPQLDLRRGQWGAEIVLPQTPQDIPAEMGPGAGRGQVGPLVKAWASVLGDARLCRWRPSGVEAYSPDAPREEEPILEIGADGRGRVVRWMKASEASNVQGRAVQKWLTSAQLGIERLARELSLFHQPHGWVLNLYQHRQQLAREAGQRAKVLALRLRQQGVSVIEP